MAEFPALPLWTDAYLADTHPLLTLEQQGCYMLLLMTQWRRHDDALPDDDKWFCRLLGVHGNKWKTLRASVLETFFTRDENGFWYQKRLRKERDFVEKRKRKAKQSAEKRWGEPRGNNNLTDANAMLRAPVLPTPTPIKKESDSSSPHSPCGELALDRFPVFDRLPKLKNSRTYPSEFDAFWEVYPLRGTDTKKLAYAAWRKPATNGVGPDALRESAIAYRKFLYATNGEPKLVSTWVTAEGWTATLQLPERNIDERTGAIPQPGVKPGGQHKGPASFVEASREVLALRSRQP